MATNNYFKLSIATRKDYIHARSNIFPDVVCERAIVGDAHKSVYTTVRARLVWFFPFDDTSSADTQRASNEVMERSKATLEALGKKANEATLTCWKPFRGMARTLETINQ